MLQTCGGNGHFLLYPVGGVIPGGGDPIPGTDSGPSHHSGPERPPLITKLSMFTNQTSRNQNQRFTYLGIFAFIAFENGILL